jgi:truncated hemoglobin YjbI
MVSSSSKECAAMGMTDKQFQSWVRFMLEALLEVNAEQDPEKRDAKMAKILDNLQRILED